MIHASLGLLAAGALILVGMVVAVLTAVMSKLATDEVSGWLPVWANALLEGAVSRVPAEYRDRYRAEWKAEASSLGDRRLSALAFAWRLRRRARSVTEALEEGVGLDIGSEPDQLARPSVNLDSERIAEIVQRVVDRTHPGKQFTFQEILEEMRVIILPVVEDQSPSQLTDSFVRDISERRRQARIRPTLPAMRRRASGPVERLPKPSKLDAVDAISANWGSNYDADWDFLQSAEERAKMRRDLRARQGGTRGPVAWIGRMLVGLWL